MIKPAQYTIHKQHPGSHKTLMFKTIGKWQNVKTWRYLLSEGCVIAVGCLVIKAFLFFVKRGRFNYKASASYMRYYRIRLWWGHVMTITTHRHIHLGSRKTFRQNFIHCHWLWVCLEIHVWCFTRYYFTTYSNFSIFIIHHVSWVNKSIKQKIPSVYETVINFPQHQ